MNTTKNISVVSLLLLFSAFFFLESCSTKGMVQVPPTSEPEEELPKDDKEDNQGGEPIEDLTPVFNNSIQVTPVAETLFTFEQNSCTLTYSDTLSGPVNIEGLKKCSVSIDDNGAVLVSPLGKGEVSLRASIGKYYNDIKFNAYDKLTLKVISDNKTEVEIFPDSGQWLYTYDVSLCLYNPGLEPVSDKYYIECEYQGTQAESDYYETFTGRIGINEPLFISKDAVRDKDYVPTLKFRKIRISGIRDTFTIGLPDEELVNHYGDPSIFEFEYEGSME